jgi:hypothetical protein
MLGSIIIGLIFAAIIFFAGKKVYKDMKSNKCSCGSSCSVKSKSKCHLNK